MRGMMPQLSWTGFVVRPDAYMQRCADSLPRIGLPAPFLLDQGSLRTFPALVRASTDTATRGEPDECMRAAGSIYTSAGVRNPTTGSHLALSATSRTSLPQDRPFCPSYLSGGLLPPPNTTNRIGGDTGTPSFEAGSRHPASTRLRRTRRPAPSPHIQRSRPSKFKSLTRSPSAGPRIHDYAVPRTGGVTHFRPGLMGVPTGPAPLPLLWRVRTRAARPWTCRQRPPPIPAYKVFGHQWMDRMC